MAGEQIQVGEAILKLRLDLVEFQKNVAKGQKSTNDFVSSMTSKLGLAKLGWVAAAGAVVTFVGKSIMEYMKLDKALSNVVATTKKYTKTQGDLRSQIEAYIDSMEEATRFQDTELADSLNELIFKTKDLTRAMYLNGLAADLSVRRNIPLQQAAEMLGNLYVGNTRGLMMVAKELGIVGENASDAGFLFSKLVAEMKGAAIAEDNQELTLKKVWTAWGNVGEIIAKATSGVTNWSLALMKMPADAFNYMFRTKSAVELVDEQIENAIGRLKSFQALQAQSPTMDYREEMKYIQDLIDNLRKKRDATVGIQKTEDQLNKELREQIEANALLLDMEKEREKAIGDIKKAQEDLAEAEEAEREEQQAAYERLGALLAGSVTQDMEAFFALVKEGNATMAQSFEMLGKAMAKSILNAIATMLEAEAAKHFAMAIGALASYDYPGAALHGAAGGAFGAAAGGIHAIANGLKDGAMITQGRTDQDTVPAMLRKNEGVIPFDDPRAVRSMVTALQKSGVSGGGGGDRIHIEQVVVPGASLGAARSAALQFGYQLDKEKQRRGQGRTKGRR